MRRALAAALACATAVAGCGGEGEPKRAAGPEPTATATVAPAPPPARAVSFPASDGKRVTGEYTAAGRRAPAVVLLHEIRGGPDQWEDLVPDLHEAGFATLAYRSRPSIIERERVPDVLGAVRWLRGRPDVDPRRIGLVGASIGASTAVYAMATGARRTAAGAVALSPPDSADIWDLQGGDRYRPHDLLLVSDDRESSSVEGMLDGAVRSKALRSQRAGHGVALLAEPGVRGALLDWLRERLAG